MVRYKTTKSTLIIAAMVILLCLVSITGATLALFTSSEEDGKIGINATAGNIKLDITDSSNENPESILGEVLNFVTTSEQSEVLFEPGSIFYTEGFRIKNDGSIPINYIIYISEDESVPDDFNEAFEVFITKDPSGRTDIEKLQRFEGRLEASQSSEVFHLVFRMKETAGNEFQNRTFTGVGITVCAVQGNVNIE